MIKCSKYLAFFERESCGQTYFYVSLGSIFIKLVEHMWTWKIADGNTNHCGHTFHLSFFHNQTICGGSFCKNRLAIADKKPEFCPFLVFPFDHGRKCHERRINLHCILLFCVIRICMRVSNLHVLIYRITTKPIVDARMVKRRLWLRQSTLSHRYSCHTNRTVSNMILLDGEIINGIQEIYYGCRNGNTTFGGVLWYVFCQCLVEECCQLAII